jgi:flagellar L-ring protein precursor FlgH
MRLTLTSPTNSYKLIVSLIVFFLVLVIPASAQYSLYQDYKATRIGDVLTVVLQENISGSSSTAANTAGANSGSAQGALTANLSPFLPLFGANSSVDYQSDDRNSANQRQLLQGNVSVRVEDIMPNGDLYVIGSRSTEINGELHKVNIKGFVRPNDINNYNEVISYRIANAEIVYQKDNSLKQISKQPGFWRKVMWTTLGVGLGVAAYVGIF